MEGDMKGFEAVNGKYSSRDMEYVSPRVDLKFWINVKILDTGGSWIRTTNNPNNKATYFVVFLLLICTLEIKS